MYETKLKNMKYLIRYNDTFKRKWIIDEPLPEVLSFKRALLMAI